MSGAPTVGTEAGGDGGYFTEEALLTTRGWSKERFHSIVTPLLQEGIIWIDDYDGKQYMKAKYLEDTTGRHRLLTDNI